jgi:hypothetical protein
MFTLCHCTLKACHLFLTLQGLTEFASSFSGDFELGLLNSAVTVKNMETVGDILNVFCIMKWT